MGNTGFSLAPFNQLQISAGMFDYGRATFHKVARIDVHKSPHILDFRMMDMPADNPVQTLILQGINDAFLIVGDELDGVFDFEFNIRR